MIEIDGKEGGGQVIRTALALSSVTGKPFRAVNIRAGRAKPGLKAQHLAGIQALEDLSFADARHEGEGSQVLEFHPGKIKPQTLAIDIGTAGSITLLLQSLLLPCCLAEGKVRLKIKGGTDVKWSMPIDYLIQIVLAHFECLADFKINEMRRGFYPKGGGLLDITIRPKASKPAPIIMDEKPDVQKIHGVSCASSSLRHAEVAERQAKAAKRKLSSLDIPVRIRVAYHETACPGSVVTLWGGGMGGDALGEPRKRSEAVGAEAGAELLYLLCSDAVVDSHLADNLIPLMGLYGGRILTDEISGHVKANISVCEKFLDTKYRVEGGIIEAIL